MGSKIETWCDICKGRYNIVNFDLTPTETYDLCEYCRIELIRMSLTCIAPRLTINCEKCSGRGYIKEYCGYNNDYDPIPCSCVHNDLKKIKLKEI